jgi:hypothetical protein
VNLLDIINKTVEIAIEKNMIKSKSIIIDATHTKARYNQKSPKEILMDRSKKLRKSVYEIDENTKKIFLLRLQQICWRMKLIIVKS